MAADPRKRQKKLERRTAKRRDKVQQLVKQKPTGLGDRLAEAARFPVLHCGVTTSLWSTGMGQVYLSRKIPGEKVAYSIFLVDRYCLGVKDAMANIRPWSAYEQDVIGTFRKRFSLEELEPAAARKLVEDAVAYAQQLGFAPHADYHKARRIFGDIDANACRREFEFGKDGKPYFIAGPHDNPQRCREVLKTLAFNRGPGEFLFTIPRSVDDGIAMDFADMPGLSNAGDEDAARDTAAIAHHDQ